MLCQSCNDYAIISTSNGRFCKKHFIKTFESRTLNTIKHYNLIRRGETIAVANSGGKDSLSLLYVLSRYFLKKNRIISITIDEGIAGYRDKTIDTMKEYCNKWGVEYKTYSYKDFTGVTMDILTKIRKGIPCAACGVLRRYMLNSAALENHADKLATAHNMDDEAENILMDLFQNDFDKMIRLGPESGIAAITGFVPRIKPFLFISEKETMLFSIINSINALHTPCPYAGFGFRGTVAAKIKELESISSRSKRNIVERMLALKKLYQTNLQTKHKKILSCTRCGAPAASELCEACVLKQQIESLKSV
jgi:uncharacterized protein (TIGR00269 family)